MKLSIRKVFSLVMAIVLVLSCNTMVFADESEPGLPFTITSNGVECTVTASEVEEGFYKTTITKGNGLVVTGTDIEFDGGDGNILELSAEDIEECLCSESDIADFEELGFTFTDGSEVAWIEASYSQGQNHVDCQLIVELLADESGDEDSYEPVIITQPVAETVCDKNDEVVLSIVADETLGHNLSYQWYSNNGNNSVLTMFPIDGATNNTYTVPTGYASTTKYYCIVTNTTADNKTYTTTSDTAVVITNLTSVNDPVVTITSGGEGTYYENTAPGVFNIVVKATDFIAFDNVVIQLLCNTTNSTDGGDVVWEDQLGQQGSQNAPLDYDTQWTGGANVTEGKPAGTYYYYPKATMEYDGKVYTVVGEAKTVTYKPYSELIEERLDGKGTENEPFLIKTIEDLVFIQSMVNRAGATPDAVSPGVDGYSFEGVFFRMENDIELPEDWEPIGSLKPYKNDPHNGIDINPFSGIFDGGNHTITVAEGGKPLFGYVRKATIKNLKVYGERIEGEGLIDNYVVDYGPDGTFSTGVPETVSIDNVTIVAGTKTLGSGLIGGNASAQNIVTISNCTVEKDVVIGYVIDESLNGIGSIAGRFNGSIKNCISYATVNGKNSVGGLVGSKGEAMGPCTISDSSFSGSVVATGEYAGGIIGSGYVSNSAPNAPCVSIENCNVDGTVKGADKVGGIFGGEGGIAQAWDNGIGYIRNNEFRGTVEATNSDGIVGGVIAYMQSLNKYNVIENNYYSSTCGAEKGIGLVRIVDTNIMQQTPKWDDDEVTYYINTSADDLSVINETVKRLNNSDYTQISVADSNRSDDPLGADAESLCYSDDYLDKKAAAAVDEAISAIGEVTLDSEEAIEAAREAYDALSEEQKKLVTKLDVLEAAEKKLEELKAEAEANKKAAAAVDEAIAAIGETEAVTLDSEEAIEAARAAYEALTDEQKKLVTKLDVLEAAEKRLEELKKAAADGTITKAVDKNGKDIAFTLDDVDEKHILTKEKAAKVNDKIDSPDQVEILWQKDIVVPDGTAFPATLTFAVPKDYQDKDVFVYHYNGTDWEVVAEGKGSEVSAKFDSLSPGALVAKTNDNEVPATGDSSNMYLWAGACVAAVACAVIVVISGRKRRED